MERALVIMTRVPIAGETKTRLMPHFSGEECVAFHEACLKDLKDHLENANVSPYIFYAGVPRESFVHLFSRDVQLLPQIGVDLGERMKGALQKTLERHKHVILIGSDVPNLRLPDLDKAFGFLEKGKDLVLGPALDGGYYLIGLSTIYPELFEEVVWGGAQVLNQTLTKAEQLGLSYGLLRVLQDIDTFEDLMEYMSEVENSSTHAWQVTESILKRKDKSFVNQGHC